MALREGGIVASCLRDGKWRTPVFARAVHPVMQQIGDSLEGHVVLRVRGLSTDVAAQVWGNADGLAAASCRESEAMEEEAEQRQNIGHLEETQAAVVARAALEQIRLGLEVGLLGAIERLDHWDVPAVCGFELFCDLAQQRERLLAHEVELSLLFRLAALGQQPLDRECGLLSGRPPRTHLVDRDDLPAPIADL